MDRVSSPWALPVGSTACLSDTPRLYMLHLTPVHPGGPRHVDGRPWPQASAAQGEVSLTLGTYSHVVPELAQEAAERIDRVLWAP